MLADFQICIRVSLNSNGEKQPPEVFWNKSVLRNFTKFKGKHLCQSLRPAALLKKRLWDKCFPVTSMKFLRTTLGDCFLMA